MENRKITMALKKQLNEKYYTARDLQYGNQAGTFLSPLEYRDLIEYKESLASESDPFFVRLPLPAFNSECLFYAQSRQLSSLLARHLLLEGECPGLSDRFSASFTQSRIRPR